MQARMQITRRGWFSAILQTSAVVAVPIAAMRFPMVRASAQPLPRVPEQDLEQWLVASSRGRVPAHVARLIARKHS